MNDEDKRRWAIEQAIKLHGSSGLVPEAIISAAQKLLDYVNESAKKDSPQ